MGRTSLPLFQINQYQNRNQNKAVPGLQEMLRLRDRLFSSFDYLLPSGTVKFYSPIFL